MDQKQYDWLDALRALAITGVIFIHTSSYLLYGYGEVPMNLWWLGNIIDGCVRFSVPIFFMISGALLLSKEYTLSQFYRKRFIRLIPPFLFWSLVYIAYTVLQKFYHGEHQSFADILELTYNGLLYGSQYHLWFVYTLIGIYLFIPMIRKWVKSESQTKMLVFLVIWVFILSINDSFIENSKMALELSRFAGYFGYAIFGYYLFINKNKWLNNKWAAFSLIAIGTLITIFGTYFATIRNESFVIDFYDFLSLNVMICSMGVFLLVKNARIKNEKLLKAIKLLSKNSYGIYLAHVLVLLVMSFFGINENIAHPVISIPFVSFSCLLISYLLIRLMKMNRTGRFIAG